MYPKWIMLNLPPIYPITDARLDVSLSEQVRGLGEAGFPLVQFRGKPLDAKTQWDELRKSLKHSADHGGWPFICVNDRADLAVLAAHEGLAPWGLHLGQEDLPPSVARRLPGLEGIHLGTSTHNTSEWQSVDSACDHGGCGPFRATSTKGDHAKPIGVEGLKTGCGALRSRGIAPIAIGGLTAGDASTCFEAGAESLAMVGEVARSENASELLWRAQVERWRVLPPLRRSQGLLLVGGSGSGKSALAQELAPLLGLPMMDSDAMVEDKVGCSIARIFAERGEAAFRDLEERVLLEALLKPGVVAIGGGAWEHASVRKEAARRGFSVLWLAERPTVAWARVAGDPLRPLAQDRTVFMNLWRKRSATWSQTSMLLPVNRTATELANALYKGA